MKKNILIIDDSRPILTLLHIILHKKFNVFSFPNAFEAMEWLNEGNIPDLIISDLQMPYIHGLELITYLSKSARYEETPILILSGLTNEEILNQLGEQKVAGLITKPFDPLELINKVNKILNGIEQSKRDSFLFI